MGGLDIDDSLPGEEVEEDAEEEVIRRENEEPSSASSFPSTDNWSSSSDTNEESLRGWLYLIAGAGYGLLVVYLFLVIFMEMKLPILSNEDVKDTNGALTTAILISAMVYVTIWFFMSGKKHSFFVEDPDKAKFYAGIIGLASLVIIALSWEDYSREMVVSAILTSVSTWSYIKSAEMKD